MKAIVRNTSAIREICIMSQPNCPVFTYLYIHFNTVK